MEFRNNKVTALANTNSANFWSETPTGSDLSVKFNQKVSTTYTRLTFSDANSSYAAVGQQVRMGMENAEWVTSHAFVSGDVDFR